jgi:hypothetical protein
MYRLKIEKEFSRNGTVAVCILERFLHLAKTDHVKLVMKVCRMCKDETMVTARTSGIPEVLPDRWWTLDLSPS